MKRYLLFISCVAAAAISCEPGNIEPSNPKESDGKYVGQAVGNFTAAEWYPGGELGTTDNVAPGCYEDPAPAVVNMGLSAAFNQGEAFFERNVTVNLFMGGMHSYA